jgi:hypothetical protein
MESHRLLIDSDYAVKVNTLPGHIVKKERVESPIKKIKNIILNVIILN